jgi:hypothetical protein
VKSNCTCNGATRATEDREGQSVPATMVSSAWHARELMTGSVRDWRYAETLTSMLLEKLCGRCVRDAAGGSVNEARGRVPACDDRRHENHLAGSNRAEELPVHEADCRRAGEPEHATHVGNENVSENAGR